MKNGTPEGVREETAWGRRGDGYSGRKKYMRNRYAIDQSWRPIDSYCTHPCTIRIRKASRV